MKIGIETEIWNESLKVKLKSDCEFGVPTVRGQNLPHQHFPGAQFAAQGAPFAKMSCPICWGESESEKMETWKRKLQKREKERKVEGRSDG